MSWARFCRYAAQLKVSLGALAVPAGADGFWRVEGGESGNGRLRWGRRLEEGAEHKYGGLMPGVKGRWFRTGSGSEGLC